MDKEPQVFRIIELGDLLENTQSYKGAEWRLGQICATAESDTVELVYTFVKGGNVENLEIHIPENTVVPSISSTYLEAFVFENETHDLFGVDFSDVAIDYEGKFLKTSVVSPGNPHSEAAVAAARKAGAAVDVHEAAGASADTHENTAADKEGDA